MLFLSRDGISCSCTIGAVIGNISLFVLVVVVVNTLNFVMGFVAVNSGNFVDVVVVIDQQPFVILWLFLSLSSAR